MLAKPDLQDDKIMTCLQEQFGLQVSSFAFLPLGADLNTAVYRATDRVGKSYFVKLRSGNLNGNLSGNFDEISARLPKFLRDQGIAAIIAPLETQNGKLWAELDDFKVILSPFVEAHNGYEIRLSNCHWRDLGAALKRVHAAQLPPALMKNIQQEGFSAYWRDVVRDAFERIDHHPSWGLSAAQHLSDYLQSKRAIIFDLLQRTGRYARALQAQSPEFVLCHADVHAGNILIDDADDSLYIVDWDTSILAPKERDLMYAGGGQFGDDRTPQEEETLFYAGYGPTQVNPVALAYYRYERILEDLAVYCQQFFSATEEGDDLAQSLRYLQSNFLPGGAIEIAYRSDKA